MTRDEIINIFFKNGKIIALRTHENYLKKHNYYNTLINYYSDSTSINETLYRIYHNLDIRPVCKICGKPVTFNTNRVFSTYCSKKCLNSDPDIILKNKEGVSKALKHAYLMNGNSIKEKRLNTLKERYNTNGNTSSPFSIKEIQDKAINTVINKFGVDNVFRLDRYRRTRELMLELSVLFLKSKGYDIEYINDRENLKIKIYNGCSKHGDIMMDWSLFNNRTRDNRKIYTVLCPICNPIKNLETSIETIIKLLLDKYNIKYEQHNREIIKPFELDFYLPYYNIAIECNGSYWHSGYESYCKHENKLSLCKEKNVKLIYYWSYLIYNNITDVEIDLCHLLNISNNNIYKNNIYKILDDITYIQYSILKDNIKNYKTKYIAIPKDKDIINLQIREKDAITYYVDYRNENIIDRIDINILDNIELTLEKTLNNKGISLCWSTKFNLYKV